MRQINPYSHIPFVHTALMALIPRGSFCWHMRKAIGNEIDAMMGGDDESYASTFPVKAFFLALVNGEDLILEWLSNERGEFFDHSGQLLASNVHPELPAAQQMAAFGLWFIDVELESCGPAADEDYDINRINPHGWRESEVISHKAECLLNAYQALSYAQRLAGGKSLTPDEASTAAEIDFKLLKARIDERKKGASAAANAKYEPNRRAREFIEKEWVEKRDAYDGNKSSFARDYVAILKNQFTDRKGDPFKITEKQLKDEWLPKKPPPAR